MANTKTFGKYINGNTIMHKLNPRIKILINIIFIVLVFIAQSFIYVSIILFLSVIAFLLTNLPKKQLYGIFKTVLFIGIFLFVINSFLLKQGYGAMATGNVDHPLRVNYNAVSKSGFFFKDITLWRFHINDKSVLQTIFIMLRIYIMIVLTTILTATTKPTALTRSIEDLLWPLRLVFFPVSIIAMIISIALRFIPTLLEEAQRIMKAQASRGVDFKNGSLKSKAKSVVTLIIPLFVSAFAKAEDLGNAMETRGYNPYQKRVKYRTYPFRFSDLYFVIIVIAVITLVALTSNGVIATPWWWI